MCWCKVALPLFCSCSSLKNLPNDCLKHLTYKKRYHKWLCVTVSLCGLCIVCFFVCVEVNRTVCVDEFWMSPICSTSLLSGCWLHPLTGWSINTAGPEPLHGWCDTARSHVSSSYNKQIAKKEQITPWNKSQGNEAWIFFWGFHLLPSFRK